MKPIEIVERMRDGYKLEADYDWNKVMKYRLKHRESGRYFDLAASCIAECVNQNLIYAKVKTFGQGNFVYFLTARGNRFYQSNG